MSKFLKFIVHFVVICTILCVVALVVPPFLGITTEIQDSTAAQTNLPIGSVTYAIPVKSAEVRIGDPILVTEDSSVFRYNLASIDLESGRGTVIDPAVTNAEPVTVAIRDYVPRIVLEVPFIGYLMMATESVEGLVILGLVALFLIVLYIIAELWKHSPEPEEDYEEEVRYPSRQASASRGRARQAEAEQLPARNQARRKEKPRKKNYDGKIRTGGFVDEVDESDFYEEAGYEAPYDPEEDMMNAANEAHDVLRKEIAAATGGRSQAGRDRRSQQGAPVRRNPSYNNGNPNARPRQRSYNGYYEDERVRQGQPRRRPEGEYPAGPRGGEGPSRSGQAYREQEGGRPRRVVRQQAPAPDGARPDEDRAKEELRELAIPNHSPEELAKKAEEAGDQVEIVKDDVTEVTLLDYSDLFANIDSEEEQSEE